MIWLQQLQLATKLFRGSGLSQSVINLYVLNLPLIILWLQKVFYF